MYVLLQTFRCPDETAAASLIERIEACCASLPTILAYLVAPPLQRRPADPHVICRLCFGSEADYHSLCIDPVWGESVSSRTGVSDGFSIETVFYRRTNFCAPEGDIKAGIWRALVVSVRAGVGSDQRTQFEAEMRMMPRYIASIKNWALNRVLWSSGTRLWSHVWEQDFADEDGLMGEYRMHPIHFGLVDRWYDPEHPDNIIDPRRLRMVCSSPFGAVDPPRFRLKQTTS